MSFASRLRHFIVTNQIEAPSKVTRQQNTLCLAFPVGDNEPRGIFVGIGHDDTAMVFTGLWKEKEEYVSIGIQHQVGTDAELDRLYPQAWMNGVWFAPYGTRKPFLFPLPLCTIAIAFSAIPVSTSHRKCQDAIFGMNFVGGWGFRSFLRPKETTYS